MNYELAADTISCDDAGEMLFFAFSADGSDPAKYVMFQCPLRTDEQDSHLGLNGLYIERDDQVFGCYNGVKSITKLGDRIEIDLNDEGQRHLRVKRLLIAPVNWSPMIDQGFARLAELSRGQYFVEGFS